MLLAIILLVGSVSFIEALFDKFQIWNKLELLAMNAPNRILNELLNCRFCLRFWLSVLTYVLLYVFSYVNEVNLTVLVVSNGIIYLMQKK